VHNTTICDCLMER